MKKVLSLMLVVVMVLSLFAGLQITSSAALVQQGSLGGTVSYELYDNGRLIIKGTGSMNHYSSTNESPFYKDYRIKVVEVQNGVTALGSYLFCGCNNLDSFLFGGAETLMYIGDHTFANCTKLSRIVYPDAYDIASQTTITQISSYAFQGCTSLKSFRIPQGVTTIETGTFEGCSALKSIAIPQSCTRIKANAFADCYALTYRFYSGLYYDWDNITIDAGNSMLDETYYHANCFGDLIGDNCYFYCYPNRDLYIEGKGATWDYAEVDPGTPMNDWYIDSVYIADGITRIGHFLFNNCNFIEQVTIPRTVTSIGDCAFYGCDALATVNYYGTQSQLNALATAGSSNGALLSATFNACKICEGACGNDLKFSFNQETGKMTISGTGEMYSYNLAQDGEFTMPWNNYRSEITSLEIKSGVTSIGKYAFISTSITELTTPSSLTRINPCAFANCIKIKNSIIINGTKCLVSKNAFQDSGASSVNSITLNGVALVETNAFAGVKAKALDLGNVLTIKDGAFANNTKVESVTIPKSCSTLGNAFTGCTALQKLEILSSVCQLGNETMVPATATIRGYKDSTAHFYATKYSRTFEIIPCDTHTYATDPAVAATCVKPGKTAGSHCSVCGMVFVAQTEIPPTGVHNYQEEVTAPTCTEKGYTTYTCSVCADTYTGNFVNAKGHTQGGVVTENVIHVTCTADGCYDEVVYCITCGAEISRTHKTIPASGSHTPALAVTENEYGPDCISSGSYDEVVYCAACGVELSRETIVIPAYGHHYKPMETVVKPTTVKAGYNSQKCTVCGVTSFVSTAPTGVVKTVKCKARTAADETILWSAVKGAQGYQIQISTKDGKAWDKTINAKTKTSYTFKKLAAGGTYKFRVRIYAKGIDGKWSYGAWTKAITSPTLPSGTSLTKVAGGSKSFTAQWKQNKNVNGYQVQYSLKSNFSGAKTVTIKSNKTLKTTVKKLNAKKVYYVRIRTYKTISGANYFSAWSKAVKVKTK